MKESLSIWLNLYVYSGVTGFIIWNSSREEELDAAELFARSVKFPIVGLHQIRHPTEPGLATVDQSGSSHHICGGWEHSDVRSMLIVTRKFYSVFNRKSKVMSSFVWICVCFIITFSPSTSLSAIFDDQIYTHGKITLNISTTSQECFTKSEENKLKNYVLLFYFQFVMKLKSLCLYTNM